MMYRKNTLCIIGILFLLFLISTFFNVFVPTKSFPGGQIFTVSSGETLDTITANLETENYIRSEFIFKFVTRFVLSGSRSAVAADYFFEKPLSTYTIARRVINGTSSIAPIRVTLREGLNKFEMAVILESKLPKFDANEFLKNAPEGYLFPDTYFFDSQVTEDIVIKIMFENFYEKIAGLEDQIKVSGRSVDEIIKVASIIETEARQTETRKTIADILWRRLDMDMPLQVDVSFKYINGKNTYNLTEEDLKIDSPYNTYLYAGLPPTPIANPGLSAIKSTIEPLKNEYLFFLSDRSGTMYYAETFEKHKENKRKYFD